MDSRDFLEIAKSQIRSKRALPMIEKELENHIIDQKNDYMDNGMEEQAAESEAVRQMGDPVEIGIQLDRVHRPQMEWSIVLSVALLSIVGFVVRMCVLTALSSEYGIASSFLGYASDFVFQLIFAFVGVGIMLLVCRFNYTVIGKYPIQLWFVIAVIIVRYVLVTKSVNGGYMDIPPSAYLWLPVYAGIVYHYRGAGTKGLLKSMLFLGAMVFLMLELPAIAGGFILGVAGLFTLTFAAAKGWFGARRLRQAMIIWIPVIALSATMAFLYISKGLEKYRQARIASFFSGGHVVNLKESPIPVGEIVQNEYLWFALFQYLGKVMGILLTAVVFIFVFRMLYISLLQNNKLGFILGISCSLFVLLQVCFYLAMNFGYIGLYTGFCMPMFTYGMSGMCITYIYSGLLLSVHRNTKLVKN